MSEELTYGQKAVGLTFNPSGDPEVIKIKSLYATAIDLLNDKRTKSSDQETKRMYSLAITDTQTAQMWAVKAITFRN